MNGVQMNGKPHRLNKPIPGCLGRMVNFFDLASSNNRLLTNKPHNDDSSLSRSRSAVSTMSSIAKNEMQDEAISELKLSSLNKKLHGTPVKVLLAEEMSKDLESRQNSPNVVARLMGLDALPQKQLDLTVQRSHSQYYSLNSHPESFWQEEHTFFSKQIDFEVHPNQDQNDYSDIYEVWHKSQRKNHSRDKSQQKGACNENISEAKLALVRHKFMEAKRLATDEKLQQTREFRDALDVLSSHGDLFIKVLQEPNSLFSHHLSGGQSVPLPSEAKRITVLKPSKMAVDEKFAAPARRNEKQAKKQFGANLWDNHNEFSPTMSMWKDNDSPAQPTRIVVLKPSPVKANNAKTVISSAPSSPRIPHSERFFLEPEDEDDQEAREVATEITQKIRENLAGHRRDETLLSSVLSNGYTGDESSFDKSGDEFATGNLSDSEVMSPASKQSWEYVNQCGGPYSSSSFSRPSYSPESSVCREAKRRLSERWAMIASSGHNQEQQNIRRSSSTLGEMLALSGFKKPEICEEGDDNTDQHPRGSTCRLSSNMSAGGSGDGSLRGLTRSKSVPVSSTDYGERLDVDVLKDVQKTKATKSSFTGKVSSLFFSKNRKAKKDKSSKPQSDDESQLAAADTPGSLAPPTRTSNDQDEVASSSTLQLQYGDKRQGLGIYSQQGGPFASQPAMPGIQGVNQEQPSPISVLDPPFEEDDCAMLGCSRSLQPGKPMSGLLSRSNLIDKSPLIGSIARTLSWDDSSTAETTSNYPLNSPFMSPEPEDIEEEWRSLVQSLLTLAGLDDEGQQLGNNVSRWHSPDSPLDPSLRDKYIDLSTKEPLHEAKRRLLRSTQKLVFDCVNATLLEMTDVRNTTSQWEVVRGRDGFLESRSGALADKVWDPAREWVLGNVKCSPEDGGDGCSLVEREVTKEVVGKWWSDQMRVEAHIIGKEIEGKLLQELVEESVSELTFKN